MEMAEAVRVLSRHVNDPDGLLYKLARAEGLDHDGYRQLVQALRRIADDWKGRTEVPRDVVALAYALDKAFESFSYAYHGAEGDIVRSWAMEITSILIDMFEE